MCDMLSSANSIGMTTKMILDVVVVEKIYDHLLPKPKAMSIGSLIELSSFPFFRKRSGLNSRGSGNSCSSFNIALGSRV